MAYKPVPKQVRDGLLHFLEKYVSNQAIRQCLYYLNLKQPQLSFIVYFDIVGVGNFEVYFFWC